MPDKQETSTKKANAAMRQFVQSGRFIFIIFVTGLLYAAATIYYVPGFISRDTVVFYRIAVPVIGVALTLLVSWLFFLARASGLETKEEKGKLELPPFVPDKEKFFKEVSEALDAAYNCLQLKYLAAVLRESGHPTAQGITEESQRATEKYGQLQGRLEDEGVTAIGKDNFEKVASEFQELMSLLDADVFAVYGDKRPNVDVAAHKFRYDKTLQNVIKKYDEISGS